MGPEKRGPPRNKGRMHEHPGVKNPGLTSSPERPSRPEIAKPVLLGRGMPRGSGSTSQRTNLPSGVLGTTRERDKTIAIRGATRNLLETRAFLSLIGNNSSNEPLPVRNNASTSVSNCGAQAHRKGEVRGMKMHAHLSPQIKENLRCRSGVSTLRGPPHQTIVSSKSLSLPESPFAHQNYSFIRNQNPSEGSLARERGRLSISPAPSMTFPPRRWLVLDRISSSPPPSFPSLSEGGREMKTAGVEEHVPTLGLRPEQVLSSCKSSFSGPWQAPPRVVVVEGE
ncbi:hypothetical protein CEXT_681071 [Caerostris extrusa]|uniref:Uncharacterized protein n=1 Tax=Caerostris extrusa TaxID=172846 RepID=A0AAV4WNF2_CAEEX|nr:hypothetical protein CEXT_681071 [Caerostris extrusa]